MCAGRAEDRKSRLLVPAPQMQVGWRSMDAEDNGAGQFGLEAKIPLVEVASRGAVPRSLLLEYPDFGACHLACLAVRGAVGKDFRVWRTE